MALVDSGDAPPFRVQVGLGQHAGRARAPAQCLLQKVELGFGELLGGVGDEEHPVRLVQRTQGDDAVRRIQAANAGGVDQAEAGPQDPPGEPDLDRSQPPPIPRIPGFGYPPGDRVDRHRLRRRLPVRH
jgi:hypothetical protein